MAIENDVPQPFPQFDGIAQYRARQSASSVKLVAAGSVATPIGGGYFATSFSTPPSKTFELAVGRCRAILDALIISRRPRRYFTIN